MQDNSKEIDTQTKNVYSEAEKAAQSVGYIPSFDAEDISEVNAVFQTLNRRIFELYRFVLRYNGYIYSSHHYGGAEPLTMIEVHTLTYIEDNPGTTPSDLASYWEKTKGAISQILGRLDERGLIERRRSRQNAKTINLYVTEEGERISRAHKLYDINDILKTLKHLMEKCTAEEIDTFYKVIGVYNDVIKEDLEINSGHRTGGRKAMPRIS